MAMTYAGSGRSSRTSGGATSWQYDGTCIGSMMTSVRTTYFTNSPDGDLISESMLTGTYF
jgi:hypothetical protein